MANGLRVAGLAMVMVGAGCMAHHAGQAAPAEARGGVASAAAAAPPGMGSARCPAEVPGTQLSATDTQDGEAITFTTSPDQEAELRGCVHAMADMHNRRQQAGGMQPGGMEPGGMHQGMHRGAAPMGPGAMGSGAGEPMGMMMPPPSQASVEDVPGGARLRLTPNDPADLDRLRGVVRMHAEHMSQTRSCGMGPRGGR